jgi:hypothetical protein
MSLPYRSHRSRPSTREALNTTEHKWTNRIEPQVLTLPQCNPTGKPMVTMLVAIAEFEGGLLLEPPHSAFRLRRTGTGTDQWPS